MGTPGGSALITRTFLTLGEEQTIALAAALGRLLHAGDVVALHGELGAGKTRFVRGLARGLNLDERAVSSPTFVLMTEYPAQPNPATRASRRSGGAGEGVGRNTGGDDLDESAGGDRRAGADWRGGVPLVHVDAYRLRSAEDLAAIGWDRAADRSAVLAVEWAERVDDGLPRRRWDVRIDHEAHGRRVEISAPADDPRLALIVWP
ncbi:MAG: tRNA (adenosine(37)-N6)-threonylcarbamoyltransferase complex ATPase subunit type 1 TsaE [Phycisphaerales bacterium]|nr:tRNA (adenosine(37)-N6)-threonylcarbamoyltransferase complex ATPase subunit type 1 TsaE [Phycisphaerales bacterium]